MVLVARQSEQCVSRSIGLNGAKRNQAALLLLARVILQDVAGKLLRSTAMDSTLVLCPALSPIGIFQMAFSLCLLKHGASLPPFPLCCLLLFSCLLPIHAKVGQDLFCLPEV